MKLTVFIVALCLILHGRDGAAQGYVYTIKEFANDDYTGYLKVGHTSKNDKNICGRLSNLQTGNPRALEYFRICECDTKKTASTVETLVRKQNEQLATTLGGKREWLNVPTYQLASFIRSFYRTARDKNCECPYIYVQPNTYRLVI